MTPEDLFRKKLGLHRATVEKLRGHPELLSVVRRNIQSISHANPLLQDRLSEWEKLLDQGPEHLFAAMLDESERGQEFRKSSPIAGILTNEERWGYFRALKAELDRPEPNA